MNLLLAILIILPVFVGLMFLIKKFGRFLSPGKDYPLWSKPFLFQKLIPNLIIGLGVSCVIIFFPHWVPNFVGTQLMEKEDSVIDLMMELESFYNIPPMGNDVPSFVLLDIDDTTHQKWGQPIFTPRNKLTHLIDAAVQANPRLIVVDIDVSQPTEAEKKSLHPHDQKLHDYLEAHVKRCQQKAAPCVPIILVRAFKPSSDPIREPNIGFLEEVVTPSGPLKWGSAQFNYSQTGVWNRWRLLESTCTDGEPGVTPSIALRVMGLIRGCSEEEMQEALRPFEPTNNCKSFEDVPQSATPLSFCGLTVDTNDRIQRRVMYRIPWTFTGEPPDLPYKVEDNDGNEILQILAAYPYAESPSKANLEPLTDKIVLIGGSYDDIHSTPIYDKMPGSIIIVNTIYSLLQNQIIMPASIWALLITMSIFIVLITIIFHTSLSSTWKYVWLWLLVTIPLLGSAIYLTYYLFYTELLWFNVIIALLLVEIIRLAEKVLNKCVDWIAPGKTN